LDSQFHCPYIESREVLEKTRQKPGEKKAREIIFLSFSVPVASFPFTSGDIISGDVIPGDATSGDVISGDVIAPRPCSASNNKWMVHIYY
jgi:hypothetical protein